MYNQDLTLNNLQRLIYLKNLSKKMPKAGKKHFGKTE